MSNEFNLNIHSIEEIPGKIINLSGAQYILLKLLAEGGEKFVYPIKNKKSGLILYIAKIYKFKPGSPEVEDAISSLPWKLFDLVIPKLILYTEFHELPGAMMELQPYGEQDNPEYCKELMDIAFELQNKNQWSKAAGAFDKVIKFNPNHSMAMLNKALSLLNLGDILSAIELIQNSIAIEPNFPEAYRLLSSISMQIGKPEDAITPLKMTLERFNCDPETWDALLNIAIDYDLVEIASNALQEVNRLGSRPSGEVPQPFVHFTESLNKSIARKKEYTDILAKALKYQLESLWNEALPLCNKAVNKSKNNTLARLNFFICKYHIGEGSEIAEELLNILSRCNKIELAAAVSLGILCCNLVNMPEKAKQLALWIADNYNNHIDIPAVPIGISIQPAILETRSGMPILDALTLIENSCSTKETEKIIHLKKLYMTRENYFRKKTS